MEIKITKSHEPYYWYSNHIGEIFGINKKQIKNLGFAYQVNIEDCEIIK
jgi:hypothetical protein